MATFVDTDNKTVPDIPEDDDLPTVDADEVITELQMPCTVVITGLPNQSADATTTALSATFSSAGKIVKTIYQIDGEQQHAVVVLDTSEAATAACTMSGCTILGSTVNIIRAQQLQGDDENSKLTATEGRHTNKMFVQAKVATVGVTASAIVLGGQAVDGIKSLDERAGISKTVNAAATATTKKVTELDQQLGVSTAVKKTAASVKEGVKGIDEKYDISGRTTRAASDASKTATNLANKALENPHVAKGWGFMKGIGSSVLGAAKNAVSEANDTYKQANEQAKERRSSATTTAAAAAAPVEASSAGETKEAAGGVAEAM